MSSEPRRAAMPAGTASTPRPLAVPARASILDCPFDVMTFAGVLDRVSTWWREPGPPRTIVTMNAGQLVWMRDDPELAAACRAGDLIVADGVPVVWASRLLRTPLPERVAGVDLMAALLRRAAGESRSVYFLGAKEEVVSALVRSCQRDHPGLRVAGYRNGYFGDDERDGIADAIRASGADLLLVGMPSPFKEVWCERNRAKLGVRVILGVGGSFDVLAGFVRRAPRWMQRSGLEWAWRLAMEPRRMWRRYLVTNTAFIALLGKQALRRRGPAA